MDAQHSLLKHFLATIAYRTQKALRNAPDTFANFRAGTAVRTPHELIWHMTGVIGYARTFFQPGKWQPEAMPTFAEEIHRFHELLGDLGRLLESETPHPNISAEQLLQGPLADTLTHAGQLAMLRRLSGSPVPPENFIHATVQASNLSENQPQPAAPDPGWSPEQPPKPPGRGLPKRWYNT